MKVVDGIVLAGGRSRRFGSDKRTAEFEGEQMIASACRRMADAIDGRLITVTGEKAERLPGTWRGLVCADEIPGRGPLGGLAAGLARTEFGAVVLPVDEPLITSATLARLAQIGRETGRVAALRTATGWEPLIAFYPRAVLNDVRAALSEGSSAPHRLLTGWQAIEVEPTDERELSNINTREALRAALDKESP
jgi:molybdopterin-guanine dinucleotide biosynthesis protein A